jgi:signal transduction histidine kinase
VISGVGPTIELHGQRVSTATLRWIVGFFCSLLGALVLVAPHRFSAPFTLAAYANAWGVTALLSGVSLLAVAVFRPRPAVGFLVHALAGGALLALAASFAGSRVWTAAFTYVLLGLGTAFAGLFPASPPDRQGPPPRDLFALLIGGSAAFNGACLIAFPGLQAVPYFDPARPYLPALGAALLLSGGLLLAAHAGPARSPDFLWLAHLCAGASFFVFGVFVSLPQRAWTAVAVNWSFAAALLLLPKISPRLARLDTSSLRARLSFILAMTTSLALILTTAVATAQEELLANEQALATQRIEARAIAQNVQDYVEMNGARTYAVAALAGRIPLTAESQGQLLAASRRSYPDVTAFRTVELGGRVIAGTGTIPISPLLLQRMTAEMREEQEPRIQISLAAVAGRPLLLLAAPLRGGDSRLAGAVVAAFDSEALAHRIVREGSRVTLADGRGQRIASHSEVPRGMKTPDLPAQWDRRLRDGSEPAGSAGSVSVAGFAIVPQLEWVVAVERPLEIALAGVRRGRDLAFGLLLLVVPLAVVGGIAAAHRIARPLGSLSAAVDELTAGNLAAPLGPTSGISEVDRLSAAFREMRDRLAERTHESERLAAELRARAETLVETDRRKDEFLAMLAHELRNPLGAIANASYLLAQIDPTGPEMEKAVAIIRRQIQHLVRMVDDLLDVSRITRGKIELRRQPLDLAEVVRHAVETARPLAAAKEQKLRVDLREERLPIDGDATRLEQVLSNLLRNAVKFTGTGGNIEISAGRNGHDEVVVRVRDDGIGMAPDLLPRVFDLFAQGEQALDRSGAGLGIGLTLVRSLVELHGGRVEARSEGPGLGSEIEVRLPLERQG